MYSTAVLKIDSASKIPANWLKISRNPAIFGQNSANFRQFTHINFNLFHYAGNNPVKYVDPDGRASILQRTINDSTTNKAYHLAHVLGENTKMSPILHGLIDYGELGGCDKPNSVVQYSGSKSGFTDNDSARGTNKYVVLFSGMDDTLTKQAVDNVLSSERFGANDSDKQKEKYEILLNDCNAFTSAVLIEYEKLWKADYMEKNPDAGKIKCFFAWLSHFWEIYAGGKEFEDQ